MWEGLVGHVGEEVLISFKGLCHSPLDAAVTIRYPNVVRLLSHLALLARRSSTTPRRGSVWMSNFIIPYYLRPFKARPSRTEALAAYTAVMLSQDLSHHDRILPSSTVPPTLESSFDSSDCYV